MRILRSMLIVSAFLLSPAAQAQEEVDLELVLLADASSSIDNAEVVFQRRGYAAAITHPDVLNAIASGLLGRIAVTYVEWADSTSHEVVVPWTVIDGPAAATGFARALTATFARNVYGRNAIGSAIRVGLGLLETNDFSGLRRVIDLSGDSAHSFNGPPIVTARAEAIAAGVVINGLAIFCRQDDCSGRPVTYDLEAVFARRIIAGPGSFVVTVDGETSFAEAVRRKLVLEIAVKDGIESGKSVE